METKLRKPETGSSNNADHVKYHEVTSQCVYRVLFFLLMMLLGSAGAFADGVDIDINTAGDDGSGFEWKGPRLIISGSGTYIITGDGETANRIEVASGVTDVNITIKNVNIKSGCAFSLGSGAEVNLTLSGNNVLTSSDGANAGLEAPSGTTLTITGGSLEDKLTVTGGVQAAGIGGGNYGSGGAITISGGTVTAIGDNGAGIGGGNHGSGSAITISGGTVTAIGTGGAGIGGGYLGSSGIIIISGGTVTASGILGAGIGGGYHGSGSAITISGGTVTAIGIGGAGIGGGNQSSGGIITITGGTVKATSSSSNGNIQSQPTDGEGHNVYLNTLTVGSDSNSDKSIPAGSINGKDCAETPDAATGVYGIKDVKTDDSGNVYFYLPESGSNELITLTADGNSYGKSYKREADDTNEETLELIPDAPDVPLKDFKILKDLEDAIVCAGGSHTFEIEAEGDNLTYEWYYGNERIKGASGNTYTITNAEFRDYERYYVIVRSQPGDHRSSIYSKNVRLWVADQLPESLQFTEFPSPAITGNTYRIKLAGYPDVTQYVWGYRVQNTDTQNDGVTFSPATGGVGKNETLATFGALSAGQGLLTVTLTHPCGTREATQAIVVQYPTGVEQVAEQAVRVSPNPTAGIIKVSGTKSNQIIRIVDIAGSLKGAYPAQDGETTIDLAGFTKGIYLVHYGGKTCKVVKQ
ncbi:MAG: T9SS type A sorting domain-containing protein [Dysgonamonadaceae bacterium]|jgi:hypothetical protein|nr:T9SS type A sorting domain-containing protein [Dysgonamonadaceae bacterium]